MAKGRPHGLLGSANPRWSHRDPVEGSIPFPPGTREFAVWTAATDTAHDRLREMDARIARTAQVTLDPRVYRTQLLDLAVDRFDVWAERGFAVVSTEETRHAYECWLANYVTNWLRYVAETCPRVDMRDELERRLRKRSEAWSGRALGPSHESPLHAKATPI